VCAEQRFAYSAAAGDALAFDEAEAGPGGAGAPVAGFSAPFALSRLPPGAPNASTLALRLRVISPTRFTDGTLTVLVALVPTGGDERGGATVAPPSGALIGHADLFVPIPLPSAADASSAWWAGGRLALEARIVAAPLGAGAAAGARALLPLRDAAQLVASEGPVPSNATLALAEALSVALGLAGPGDVAAPRFPPQPLLLLSNLHSLVLDDAGYAEPVGESLRGRTLRLALLGGLPLLVGSATVMLSMRWWRAATARVEKDD
jgi:hypothetical protein